MTRVIAGVAGGRRLAVPPGRATRPTSDRAREGLFGTVHAVLGSLGGARVLDLYAGCGAVGLEALSRGGAHALLVESAPAAIQVIRTNIAALDLPGACLVPDRVERVLARGPAHLPRPEAFAPGSASESVRGSASESVRGSASESARGSQAGPAAGTAAGPEPGSPRRSVPGSGPGAAPGSAPGFRPASQLGSPPGSGPGGAGEGYDFVFADPPYAVGDEDVTAMLRALREGGWLAEGALVAVERRTGGAPLVWPPGYVADRVRRYGDTTLWYGLAASA